MPPAPRGGGPAVFPGQTGERMGMEKERIPKRLKFVTVFEILDGNINKKLLFKQVRAGQSDRKVKEQ